jgi:hypothetical protein
VPEGLQQAGGFLITNPSEKESCQPLAGKPYYIIFMSHQRKGGIHESTEYSWETFGWYRLTGLLSLQYLKR